ncbi:DivIVA domain-containing protein [Halanaerobium sp. MA284_MarDTE_T2]|uniref:DivIVA domain-containing protein n=1 Tax=Halanaerobium sp. MA284_MarDTE_T2 TaxID=2183913 RepID=UPI000DF38201|nr:DivIVA domain-containing protein [Halanaerobium sp. MA284_MarDTE_T2]RCW51392.1 cell division initiation protein [Halanaerobium sp. MA284_MarDTE_T2]
MKITPLDIYNKEFKKSTFGYNTDQVDEFMDDIGVAYERLLKEMNNLKDEKQSLQEKLSSYKDIEERLENTLQVMQDTVDKRIEQANNEARMIVKEAELKAQQIKDDAEKAVAQERRNFEQLKEKKNFFKIRFQTLLESHLEMLKEDDDRDYAGTEDSPDNNLTNND